jgi:hypothetical protein
MESRLDTARRRAGTAKRALTGAAAIGFVAALLLARASHPGHAQATPTQASTSGTAGHTGYSYDDGSSNSDGYGHYQAPQVQTHVS